MRSQSKKGFFPGAEARGNAPYGRGPSYGEATKGTALGGSRWSPGQTCRGRLALTPAGVRSGGGAAAGTSEHAGCQGLGDQAHSGSLAQDTRNVSQEPKMRGVGTVSSHEPTDLARFEEPQSKFQRGGPAATGDSDPEPSQVLPQEPHRR